MNKREKLPALGRLQHGDSKYPAALHEYLSGRMPKTLTALGNLDILQRKKLALFCSIKCPGEIILQAYDLVRALRDEEVTVISGFHSPMEKECLALLLRGAQPIIVCPARNLENMRIPTEWRAQLTAGRLLLLSPFTGKTRRATVGLARKRNEFVATLAEKVFVSHAAPGSKTEQFCRELLDGGNSLLTLESGENTGLFTLGALPLRISSLKRVGQLDLLW